jgi:hypothetical protein
MGMKVVVFNTPWVVYGDRTQRSLTSATTLIASNKTFISVQTHPSLNRRDDYVGGIWEVIQKQDEKTKD